MRIALVSGYERGYRVGNNVSLQRLATHLAGHDDVSVQAVFLETNGRNVTAIRGCMGHEELLHCDVIHGLHMIKTGLPLLRMMDRNVANPPPLVITLTGTDVNEDIHRSERKLQMRKVAHRVAGIVAYHEAGRRRWVKEFPATHGRVRVIAPGVSVGSPQPRWRQKLEVAAGEYLFVLLAGLRPVKDPIQAIESLQRLREAGLPIRLAIAGAPLDPAVASRVSEMTVRKPWARYLGELEQGDALDLLASADVVLNTSRSEGVSNALMEAMAMGRPVVARNIEGNRAIVKDGVNGRLFESESDFDQAIRELILHERVRVKLAQQAQADMAKYSPDNEAQRHIDLYRQLASRRIAVQRRSFR